MKPRTSLILAAVAIVVLIGGWYFGPNQAPAEQQHTSVGRLLFPGIAVPLEKAATIEVTHGGKTLAIVRKGDVWTLPSRGFYPTKPGKVHALLADLVGLRLVAKRTSDPKQFSALGVGDPARKGSNANLLKVLDAAGHPIVSLIVGQRLYSAQGADSETLYVRRPGQNQSWLAQGALSLDTGASLWIDHGIANIDHSRIVRIDVTRGEDHLVLAPKNGELALVAPKDHPPLAPDKLDDVWRSLEELAFSSVDSGASLPGDEAGRSVFTLQDGTTLTATLSTAKKKLWARFSVSGTSKKAAALKAKLGTWNFLLDNWRESALLPRLADLVKPKKAATP